MSKQQLSAYLSPENVLAKPGLNRCLDALRDFPKLNISLVALQSMDDYTYWHSISTAAIALAIASPLDWPKAKMMELGLAAILHDIGKMQIPKAILQKPGALNAREWCFVQRHPEYGAALLSRLSGLNDSILTAVAQHHERLDGSGYPGNLKGSAIGEMAKIIAIADVFDAMTSDRCYKEAAEPHEAIAEITNREDLFDPSYSRILAKMRQQYPMGAS